MARGDLLKAMLESYQRGDDDGFRTAAQSVIADERKKRHDLLADELEGALGSTPRERTVRIAAMQPLPKAKDDTELLALARPRRGLEEVVLKEDARSLFRDILLEFRSSSVLRAHGLAPRNRLLFVGLPGCGKSLAAEALATELGIPLATVQLATVVSSYLGETSRNLSSIFSYCSQGSWVLFFDEFDTLAKERGDRSDLGELKRVVTAFLQLLDQFSGDSIVIAATNHPALLDEAVWRRFDEVVEFPKPTQPEIARVIDLKLRTAKKRFSSRELARKMTGLTHAEVEVVCLDGLRRSILDGRTDVSAPDLLAGLERIRARKKATFKTGS